MDTPIINESYKAIADRLDMFDYQPFMMHLFTVVGGYDNETGNGTILHATHDDTATYVVYQTSDGSIFADAQTWTNDSDGSYDYWEKSGGYCVELTKQYYKYYMGNMFRSRQAWGLWYDYLY